MVKIELPEDTRFILEGDIFKLDSEIDDSMLAKFLFYVPAVVREFGLAIAELRRQKRELEAKLLSVEGELEIESAHVVLDLDVTLYKNEELRKAGVNEHTRVIQIKDEIVTIKKDILRLESDIDELTEQYWSFKSLRDSLESITKLRCSERTF